MERRQYIRCKNHDEHMARMEMTPDNNIKWVSGSFLVADMAIDYGWKRISGQWLCPECIEGIMDKLLICING